MQGPGEPKLSLEDLDLLVERQQHRSDAEEEVRAALSQLKDIFARATEGMGTDYRTGFGAAIITYVREMVENTSH